MSRRLPRTCVSFSRIHKQKFKIHLLIYLAVQDSPALYDMIHDIITVACILFTPKLSLNELCTRQLKWLPNLGLALLVSRSFPSGAGLRFKVPTGEVLILHLPVPEPEADAYQMPFYFRRGNW